jgi:hypothetical protein
MKKKEPQGKDSYSEIVANSILDFENLRGFALQVINKPWPIKRRF